MAECPDYCVNGGGPSFRRSCEPLGQFSSQLVAILCRYHDDSLGYRVKGGPVAAAGISLQANPQLITFQPDLLLASADAQLLTDDLLAHATMNHSNTFAAKGEAVLFSRHGPERKRPSAPGSDPSHTGGHGSPTKARPPGWWRLGPHVRSYQTFPLLPLEWNGCERIRRKNTCPDISDTTCIIKLLFSIANNQPWTFNEHQNMF